MVVLVQKAESDKETLILTGLKLDALTHKSSDHPVIMLGQEDQAG